MGRKCVKSFKATVIPGNLPEFPFALNLVKEFSISPLLIELNSIGKKAQNSWQSTGPKRATRRIIKCQPFESPHNSRLM